MAEESTDILTELLELHPADIADRVQRLPLDDAHDVVLRLPRALAGLVLSELEDDKVDDLVDTFSTGQLAEMLRETPPDAVADIVADLPSSARADVLAAFPAAEAEQVISLLRYPEDTAGGIMSDRFIALNADLTIQQGQEVLRHWSGAGSEDVSYLYITDSAGRLAGIVSLRTLVFGRQNALLREVMNQDVKFVRVDDDQEEIARQFEHYHYVGLPVLGPRGRLRGVVKASDALQVAQAEATEDMQLMVGLSGEERVYTPWHRSMARRLPWLYVNLGTAFLAAAVVGLFEETIKQWTVLAVFLPIVAGQGGNAGMQTLTVVIRDLALGELSQGDGRRAFMKELILGIGNGLAIGLLVGVIAFAWKRDLLLSGVAATAMLMTQIAAGLCGVLIPLGLKAVKVDPALAASIFVTTVTDIAGFFFFLGLASLGMRILS